jgi:GNAT superfamily N-acetyltransferase
VGLNQRVVDRRRPVTADGGGGVPAAVDTAVDADGIRLASRRVWGRLHDVIELRVLTPDDWPVWRELRLAALAEAPYAFGSRLADWRSQVGDQLVRAVERWARHRCARVLRLAVAQGNEMAFVLYQRNGFNHAGESAELMPDGVRRQYVMTKALSASAG